MVPRLLNAHGAKRYADFSADECQSSDELFHLMHDVRAEAGFSACAGHHIIQAGINGSCKHDKAVILERFRGHSLVSCGGMSLWKGNPEWAVLERFHCQAGFTHGRFKKPI